MCSETVLEAVAAGGEEKPAHLAGHGLCVASQLGTLGLGRGRRRVRGTVRRCCPLVPLTHTRALGWSVLELHAHVWLNLVR